MATLYRCVSCKGDFPFEQVKYSPDGKKRILCQSCLNKTVREEASRKASVARRSTLPSHIFSESGASRMICIKCRYSFSLKKASRLKPLCPYCGSNQVMVNNQTAGKILDEVSRSNYREV
ncbi:hypothetical protein HYW21_07310 [Candidatus Woesearchaeota archaeon]|nr:hypothetical protein [Candidatus Woesearchaeota archaeon]